MVDSRHRQGDTQQLGLILDAENDGDRTRRRRTALACGI